jgi:hypothetical protein
MVDLIKRIRAGLNGEALREFDQLVQQKIDSPLELVHEEQLEKADPLAACAYEQFTRELLSHLRQMPAN